MKVLNYTTYYFAIILFIIISIWAAIFYYEMLDEIYDSIDDGLDNQKGLIIQKASTDSSILKKSSFEEGDYAIKPVAYAHVKDAGDVYIDTMMYMQNEESDEPVRMLRTYFELNGKYYQMEVVTSMVEEDDLVRNLLYAMLWLYLGLVASIIILNNVMLKHIWKPFYHLLKQLKRFTLEKPSSITVKPTRIEEFRQLNETVENLLESNISSYINQKHFIENASHELQTPLAITINKLEALAESPNLNANEMALVSSALDNLDRLTRLNRSLLLLSKIENKQFAEKSEVDLSSMAEKIISDFDDQLHYSQLSVELNTKERLVVQMNHDLAVIMLTNLIKNAIVHNHPQGSISITTTGNTFHIENSGNKEPLDPKTLFTRFNSNSSTKFSTGLGMSIVKAIANLYDLHLKYSYSNKHVIDLIFP